MNQRIHSPTSDFTLSRATKRKWVKALRSGKYKQGQSSMYNSASNTWCCLGVLCHVIGIDKKKLDGQSMPYETCEKPNGAQLGMDFSIKLPKLGFFGLAELNDDGASFKRIARMIERHVPCHD